MNGDLRRAAPIMLGLMSLILGSCTSRTTTPRAAIRTDAAHCILHPGPFGREATIVSTFTAPQDTAVYFLNCNGAISWGVQRLVNDHWTDAWVVMTNSCLSAPIQIPPGGVHVDTLTLAASAPTTKLSPPMRIILQDCIVHLG